MDYHGYGAEATGYGVSWLRSRGHWLWIIMVTEQRPLNTDYNVYSVEATGYGLSWLESRGH